MKILNILGQEIKSANELTLEEVRAVMERYKTGEACGKAEDGTIFLHQQKTEMAIMATALTAKQIQEFCEERKIKWNDAYSKRVKRYVASDESVDSYGDIILQSGWNLGDRFKRNPAIMWAHNYSQPNIGSGINAVVEDKNLNIDVLFMLQETYPFADTVFKMVDSGFLKGGSVGFIPVKVIKVDDDEERAKLKLGKYGVVFEKQILLEFSVCPLGANKNALVQNSFAEAAQKGIINKQELESIVKDTNPETAVNVETKTEIDNAISMLNDKAFSLPVAPAAPETKDLADDVAIVKPGFEETENEVRYRIKDPGDFNPDTFKYVAIKKTKPRVNSVMGKLKGKDKPEDAMVLQALRFPKEDNWTVEKAKKWVEKHPDMVKAIEDCFTKSIENDTFILSLQLEIEEMKEQIESVKEFISLELKAFLLAMGEGKPDGEGGSKGEPKNPEPETDMYSQIFEQVKEISNGLSQK